jgi:hypothetical protein
MFVCILYIFFSLKNWMSEVRDGFKKLTIIRPIQAWTMDVKRVVLVSASCVIYSKPNFFSSSWQGLIREWEAGTGIHPIELDGKPFVVFTKSQELRRHNLVYRINQLQTPDLETVSSIVFSDWRVRFMAVMIGLFFFSLKGIKTYLTTPLLPLSSPTFPVSSHL